MLPAQSKKIKITPSAVLWTQDMRFFLSASLALLLLLCV
jgi:hypothetical protein